MLAFCSLVSALLRKRIYCLSCSQERCIKTGSLTVNYERVDIDYRLKHNDLLANIVHRSVLNQPHTLLLDLAVVTGEALNVSEPFYPKNVTDKVKFFSSFSNQMRELISLL